MIKADLRTFPHFFSPQSGKKVPRLLEMVNTWQKKGLDVVSLTACHTATSGVDHRFDDYMNQLDTLEGRFKVDDSRNSGYVTLFDNDTSHPLVILNSQQVRTYWNDMPIDINVLGVPKIIQPTQGLYDTIKEAKDNDGIISLCHINDKCGLNIEKAIELYEEGKVDAIEVKAEKYTAIGEEIIDRLTNKGIIPLAVTGGHNYKQAGTSYITFNNPQIGPFPYFSIDSLRDVLRKGDFTPYFGSISPFSRFLARDRHIYASAPGHILAGGKRREESKKARKK